MREDITQVHDPSMEMIKFNLFFKKGEVCEIRALGLHGKGPWEGWAKGTVSGYFDDPVKLEIAAKALDDLARATGIYFTLNPVEPALLGRGNNRLIVPKNTTADEQNVCHRWFLIDTDPVRPSGISATDTELAAAITCRDEIVAFLHGNGWPDPIKAYSGNGGHLLYRLPDMPNSTEIAELKKQALKTLNFKFGGNGVQVDQTVSNASRITKLYGTWARKGDSMPDRPHRRSYLEVIPDPIVPVSLEQLQWLAGLAPAEKPDSYAQKKQAGRNGTGKEKCARKVLESCCEKIRQSPPGDQHRIRRDEARLIGGYLQYIDEGEVLSALEQAVIASGAQDLRAAMKTVRDGLEYGKLSPITIPDLQSAHPHSELKSTSSMADLREYIDLCVVPGQKITVDEICRGLACYKRNERKILYKNVTRLCVEGILKKDDYKHGGYRRSIEIESYDLGGAISEDDLIFNIILPLELHNLIDIKTDQLLQVSGRYDAGKSSFLFQVLADNYLNNKITLIVSEEWSLNAIKERMDVLGIPRPHENIKVIPMQPGYEDMIPSGRCIALIDYIRADQNPFETDAQIQRILKNLKGGVAIFATQKHPGLDRPVGGQFAVHASHHIVLLDKWKELFTCKIYRTKKDRNLEGVYKTFKIDGQKKLYPVMEDWKLGTIKWNHEPKTNDGNDGNDGKINAVKRGGPPVKKENNKERKERSKEKKERKTPTPNSQKIISTPSPSVDTLFEIQKDSKPQNLNQDREVLKI